MLKAYKYIIYPNKEQEKQIAKHLDAHVLYMIKHYHIEKKNMRKKK